SGRRVRGNRMCAPDLGEGVEVGPTDRSAQEPRSGLRIEERPRRHAIPGDAAIAGALSENAATGVAEVAPLTRARRVKAECAASAGRAREGAVTETSFRAQASRRLSSRVAGSRRVDDGGALRWTGATADRHAPIVTCPRRRRRRRRAVT